ncbi:LysM domain-containing protein [Colletotrichum orbiculare MAFF 240422]|uniref:LysM domain-containing protein n=1 Tax=Colletotrichum orbiculare (strain 104-T / ATCC 96160 / CBS 514.97 / LARS 414 / MAFF 240422) TaxID=1213857 RepID=N4UNG2_COLOR|nr:LysM domain-containing protein [Colletotrichum orbiculare MAFF 240422]
MHWLQTVVLSLAGAQLGHCLVARRVGARGEDPNYPHDPATTRYCSYWLDHVADLPCNEIPIAWGFPLADFLRWNPSLAPDCKPLKNEWSYCVETTGEPTTPGDDPTPTDPGNGIETPVPYQSGMVSDCDKFYLIPQDSGCQAAADKNGITLADFIKWNPGVGATCSGLWADVYTCVSVVGHEPQPSAPATPTTPPNGITTPVPTQPELVGNCDRFHFVQQDQSCTDMARQYGISMTQFLAWNPKAGASCGGLWADAYACVSIIGHEPTPVQPGNGVATPSPIQSGMVANCKTFHFVRSDESCRIIADKFGITVANFVAWNPAVGSSCAGLWANTYACIAVL